MRCARQSGFTLTELLITMVVIGILAAVAVPSYSAYVTRGQRAAAKAALQQVAQFLERNYTTNGCYQYTSPAGCSNSTGAVSLPFPGAPIGGGQYTYALTVNFPSAQTFQLAAAPCGTTGTACTGSYNASFKDSTCGALLLDNTGQQSVDSTGTGTWPTTAPSAALVATCWQH
jgi:type IV pilus assembly protein PilE